MRRQQPQVKFTPGPSPLSIESSISVLKPRDSDVRAKVTRIIDDQILRLRDKDDAETEGKRRALLMYKNQMVMDDQWGAVQYEFARDFQMWLLGRGKDEDHMKTSWPRHNLATIDEEVQQYVDAFVTERHEYALQLAKLAMRVPQGINQFYLYFKYIVRGKIQRRTDDKGMQFWDISDDDFLKDWDVFVSEFSEWEQESGAQPFDPEHANHPFPYGEFLEHQKEFATAELQKLDKIHEVLCLQVAEKEVKTEKTPPRDVPTMEAVAKETEEVREDVAGGTDDVEATSAAPTTESTVPLTRAKEEAKGFEFTPPDFLAATNRQTEVLESLVQVLRAGGETAIPASSSPPDGDEDPPSPPSPPSSATPGEQATPPPAPPAKQPVQAPPKQSPPSQAEPASSPDPDERARKRGRSDDSPAGEREPKVLIANPTEPKGKEDEPTQEPPALDFGTLPDAPPPAPPKPTSVELAIKEFQELQKSIPKSHRVPVPKITSGDGVDKVLAKTSAAVQGAAKVDMPQFRMFVEEPNEWEQFLNDYNSGIDRMTQLFADQVEQNLLKAADAKKDTTRLSVRLRAKAMADSNVRLQTIRRTNERLQKLGVSASVSPEARALVLRRLDRADQSRKRIEAARATRMKELKAPRALKRLQARVEDPAAPEESRTLAAATLSALDMLRVAGENSANVETVAAMTETVAPQDTESVRKETQTEVDVTAARSLAFIADAFEKAVPEQRKDMQIIRDLAISEGDWIKEMRNELAIEPPSEVDPEPEKRKETETQREAKEKIDDLEKAREVVITTDPSDPIGAAEALSEVIKDAKEKLAEEQEGDAPPVKKKKKKKSKQPPTSSGEATRTK